MPATVIRYNDVMRWKGRIRGVQVGTTTPEQMSIRGDGGRVWKDTAIEPKKTQVKVIIYSTYPHWINDQHTRDKISRWGAQVTRQKVHA